MKPSSNNSLISPFLDFEIDPPFYGIGMPQLLFSMAAATDGVFNPIVLLQFSGEAETFAI